jgi:hypothetical protein
VLTGLGKHENLSVFIVPREALLKKSNLTFGFHKKARNFLQAERLSATQEGFCSKA